MRWTQSECDPELASQLCRRTNLTPVASQLLWQRGIQNPSEAEAFLNPRLRGLDDPFAITHLERAVDRILKAIRKSERIAVFGDYDVDGVTSTALLVSIFQRYGITPKFYVPRRLEEGYGLSRRALDRVIEEQHPQLLIAVDCGTSSVEEVAWLRSQGIDVVILDHHTSKAELPEDCILVNPHVFDPGAIWEELCSVGLVFKLIHGLIKRLRHEGDPLAHEIDLKDYIELVALGTVADLVPLIGENRILARTGLRMLKASKRPGLFALYQVAGIEPGSEIDPFDISFRIGPRINASGRLDDASRPIELLLSEDLTFCRLVAKELDEFNRERQAIESEITEKAQQMVESQWKDDHGFVLYSPEWHPGVVGIVASRISKQFHRPTLVMGADGDVAKGSGRTVSDLDLVALLKPCASHLERWGGHPMAVGVETTANQLDDLRQSFNASIRDTVGSTMPEPILNIDSWLTENDLSERLLEDLELLAPFGQGNPEPVFACKGVKLKDVRPFGTAHTRFRLVRPKGLPISGVAWKSDRRPPPQDELIDIAFRFHWNTWRGRKEPRITLADWRVAG